MSPPTLRGMGGGTPPAFSSQDMGVLCVRRARLRPQPLAGGGTTSKGSVPSLGPCQKCLRFGLAVTFRSSVEPETLAASAWLCFRGH